MCLIFGLYTLHASTTNLTDKFRISCDIRFQPAGEKMMKDGPGKIPWAIMHGERMSVRNARSPICGKNGEFNTEFNPHANS